MMNRISMIFCFVLAVFFLPMLSTSASAQVNVKTQEKPTTVRPATVDAGTKGGGSSTQNREEKPKSSVYVFESCCTRVCTGGPGESGQWSKSKNGTIKCDGTPGPLVCPPPLDGDLVSNTGGNTPKTTSANTKITRMGSAATTTTSPSGSNTQGSGVSRDTTPKNIEFDPKDGAEKAPLSPETSNPKITPRKKP